MFRVKKIGSFKNFNSKNFLNTVVRFLGRYIVRQYLVYLIILFAGVYSAFAGFEYIYFQSVIDKQIAVVQNEAIVISAEYAGYSSLNDAKKDGMNTKLVTFSSLNQIRIRVVDLNYKVYVDTYSADKDKIIVNPRVFTTFEEMSNQSEYIQKSGIIEATAPVYNDAGEMMAVIVVDLDISDIREMFKNVDDLDNNIKVLIYAFSVIALAAAMYILNKPFRKAMTTIMNVNNGHMDERLPVKGYTELKDLARDFNGIMDNASELDKSRSEFVSNVSHELKTPITSIKVLAESLNTVEDAPIEMYQEFMQDIVSEIDRESKIIEDLLSLVRMDKSAQTLNIASVSINELLEMVLKRLKPLAKKKNIDLLFESFRPVVAQIDEVKMTQVISNLVENAIKYNKDEGWVHVSLNADHQYFYVRVEDSGIGIPEESINKIFERFYRVDKARSRQSGGTGLGLAIVRNIIILHHGIIKVHSEENVGTTFTMRIPLNYVENK